MSAGPKVDDIGDEDNILTTKIKLTKNEYNATIRNKLEYNRLKVITRHLTDENDLSACRLRSSTHDLRKWLDENQKVVCNIDEFFLNRQIQSASAKRGSRLPGVRSSLARTTGTKTPNRAKSASIMSRPYTAPLQRLYDQQTEPGDLESDDETTTLASISRMTSAKRSISGISSSVLSQHPVESTVNTDDVPVPFIPSTTQRITWPVKLKVFAIQDEDEARQQYLAWRAEQRRLKTRRSSRTFFDLELERKYQASILRRQEIEAYATPELIEAHKIDDPIFAKRYRQLKLAVRSGKVPAYDKADTEINITMTKSKIERARTALITAKQSKIKTFYRNQQTLHDTNLSKRVQAFLDRVKKLKQESENQV